MASAQIAYIGLGSNLNDPLEQLSQAKAALEILHGSAVKRCSRLYWSTAVGPGKQPDYLNAVMQLQTQLNPTALLGAMRKIENDQGRTRDVRWGARTLDLDLLLFDQLVVDQDDLCIPHPRMHERNFVIYPLYDIAPKLRLPDGPALIELRKLLPDTGLRLAEHEF